jgi:hypothetical protein
MARDPVIVDFVAPGNISRGLPVESAASAYRDRALWADPVRLTEAAAEVV